LHCVSSGCIESYAIATAAKNVPDLAPHTRVQWKWLGFRLGASPESFGSAGSRPTVILWEDGGPGIIGARCLDGGNPSEPDTASCLRATCAGGFVHELPIFRRSPPSPSQLPRLPACDNAPRALRGCRASRFRSGSARLKRIPGGLRREFEIPDIRAQAQADTGTDWHHHDVVGRQGCHAKPTD
jgi:hypothetical protein